MLASSTLAQSDGRASGISVLAIESLMPSLRAACHYVLTVAAQRYPALLLRLHAAREEVYLLLASVLEAHSLLRHRASFAEYFYGMQRFADGAPPTLRSSAAQWMALVLTNYVRIKVD